ncbi:MAG: AbrB/MazE/SpoVT family DNA-binding domain-containing protein [Chthoniobacteraceae bacterium]
MTKVIPISPKGALILPMEMRKKLGVASGGQLIVDDESGEVVLRAGLVTPLEVYSPAQISAFKKLNEGPLAKKKVRWAR